ncbi:MAG: hypothetical protein D6694_09210 [Gammaproteobacteria bacterium]|nr:MAG: hypothetical protein D6694_09210 [Gammaproteobacteria bacterium]
MLLLEQEDVANSKNGDRPPPSKCRCCQMRRAIAPLQNKTGCQNGDRPTAKRNSDRPYQNKTAIAHHQASVGVAR